MQHNMKRPTHHIVIDDDPINNMLCKILIKNASGSSEIQTFTMAERALDYIINTYPASEIYSLLFLDINMPTLSGWEFLDRYEKLDDQIKKQIRIYMVSSSIDPRDRKRAKENKNVVDYISKPLSVQAIRSMIENLAPAHSLDNIA
jgi:CheY-like chemotaxis protein